MIEMMIDGETLSTKQNAAIASLGYTIFNRTVGIMNKGGWVVNVASSILAGGDVDPGTVEWWRCQTAQAKDAISNGGVRQSSVLEDLTKVYKENKCERVWSHGLTFDVALLENTYAREGMAHPWSHKQPRDTRTAFEIAEEYGFERSTGAPTHCAVQDAVDQTEDLIRAFSLMNPVGLELAMAAKEG